MCLVLLAGKEGAPSLSGELNGKLCAAVHAHICGCLHMFLCMHVCRNVSGVCSTITNMNGSPP